MYFPEVLRNFLKHLFIKHLRKLEIKSYIHIGVFFLCPGTHFLGGFSVLQRNMQILV